MQTDTTRAFFFIDLDQLLAESLPLTLLILPLSGNSPLHDAELFASATIRQNNLPFPPLSDLLH